MSILPLIRVIDTPPDDKGKQDPCWIDDMDEMCGKWVRLDSLDTVHFKSSRFALRRDWYQTLEEVFAGLTEVTVNVTPDPFTFQTNYTESAYRQFFKPRQGKTYKISNNAPAGYCDGIFIHDRGDKVFLPPPWILMQTVSKAEVELDMDTFLKQQRDEIFRKMFAEN